MEETEGGVVGSVDDKGEGLDVGRALGLNVG